MFGHTATVTVLLIYGALINLFDKVRVANSYTLIQEFLSALYLAQDKSTPLIAACAFGSTATARVLLNHGALVDHFNKVEGSSTMSCTHAYGLIPCRMGCQLL